MGGEREEEDAAGLISKLEPGVQGGSELVMKDRLLALG